VQVALVDEFAPIRLQVEQFRPIQNHHDRLWEKLKVYLENRPADKPAILKGTKYEIHLTECATKRHVLPKALDTLKRVFGIKRWRELVANAFPVTPIDALLRPEQQNGIVETRQDGARRIAQVIEIDGPAAAQAA
jgi:hypothetical protein